MDVKLPELGEDVRSGIVLKILVHEGDTIEAAQPIVELETDKATTEVPSPEAGVVQSVQISEGDEVSAGQTLLTLEKREIEPEVEQPEAPAAPEEEQPRPPAPKADGGVRRAPPLRAPAPPTLRRLARELGVDLDDVAPTGPGASVTEDDLKSHVRALLDRTRFRAGDREPELPDFSRFGEVERVPMSSVRRATAESVSGAWRRVVPVTQFDRADITELSRFRERLDEKPTLTAIVVRLAALVLGRFPELNASLDTSRDELVLKRYVHMGVAVDTEQGLLVPVLRDVDRKGVRSIARELEELAARARARKLGRDELSGASFTLTNLGPLGTTYFAPVVPWPQVAILGVGRAMTEAIWRDGAFEPRSILPLSIAYDHRAIDGADAARFLRFLAETLEQPLRIVLED